MSETFAFAPQWLLALSTSGLFLLVAFVWTMLDPGYLDLSETSAIKVEKIDFPKTKLAHLVLKLFLHRINSVKALRRQKVMDGGGCRISRFVKSMRDRSTRLSIYQIEPRFAMVKLRTSQIKKQSNQLKTNGECTASRVAEPVGWGAAC